MAIPAPSLPSNRDCTDEDYEPTEAELRAMAEFREAALTDWGYLEKVLKEASRVHVRQANALEE